MYAQMTEDGFYGCKHYKRKCLLQAPCCKKFYVCRVCHDENENHTIDRFAVRTIQCMLCGELQPPGRMCQNKKCRDLTHPTRRTFFAQYHCKVCNLFDDSGRALYHCEHCGLCRVGSPHSNIHCHTCNICWNLSGFTHHTCKPDILKENCPVCEEYLQVSRKTTYILECGHCFHSDCLGKYYQDYLGCHRCLKPMQDLQMGSDTIKKFYYQLLPWTQRKRRRATNNFPLHEHSFQKMTQFLTLEDMGRLMRTSREVAAMTLEPVIWRKRMRKNVGFEPFPFVHPFIQVKYQHNFTQKGAAACVALAAGDWRAVVWFLEAGLNPFLLTNTEATHEWITNIPSAVKNIISQHKLRWLTSGNEGFAKLLSRPEESETNGPKQFPLPFPLTKRALLDQRWHLKQNCHHSWGNKLNYIRYGWMRWSFSFFCAWC